MIDINTSDMKRIDLHNVDWKLFRSTSNGYFYLKDEMLGSIISLDSDDIEVLEDVVQIMSNRGITQ